MLLARLRYWSRLVAIDSREKRQAAAYYNRRWAIAPTPNAAKDQEWRQEVMRSYPGILAGAAAAVVEAVVSRVAQYYTSRLL